MTVQPVASAYSSISSGLRVWPPVTCSVSQLRSASVVMQSGHVATLGGGWWTRIGSVVPLIALVAGLITISVLQDEDRASELAEVDSALLTDDLPPAAYTDPGFAQFLKADGASD